ARMAMMVATAITSRKVVPRSLRRTGLSFLEDGRELEIHPCAVFSLHQGHLVHHDEALRRLDAGEEAAQVRIAPIERQGALAAHEVGALHFRDGVAALLRLEAGVPGQPL